MDFGSSRERWSFYGGACRVNCCTSHIPFLLPFSFHAQPCHFLVRFLFFGTSGGSKICEGSCEFEKAVSSLQSLLCLGSLALSRVGGSLIWVSAVRVDDIRMNRLCAEGISWLGAWTRREAEDRFAWLVVVGKHHPCLGSAAPVAPARPANLLHSHRPETPLRNAALPLPIVVIRCHSLIDTLIHCSPCYCCCTHSGFPVLARQVPSAFLAYHFDYWSNHLFQDHSVPPGRVTLSQPSRNVRVGLFIPAILHSLSLFFWTLVQSNKGDRIWIHCADATAARILYYNIISWYWRCNKTSRHSPTL